MPIVAIEEMGAWPFYAPTSAGKLTVPSAEYFGFSLSSFQGSLPFTASSAQPIIERSRNQYRARRHDCFHDPLRSAHIGSSQTGPKGCQSSRGLLRDQVSLPCKSASRQDSCPAVVPVLRHGFGFSMTRLLLVCKSSKLWFGKSFVSSVCLIPLADPSSQSTDVRGLEPR